MTIDYPASLVEGPQETRRIDRMST